MNYCRRWKERLKGEGGATVTRKEVTEGGGGAGKLGNRLLLKECWLAGQEARREW